MLECGFEFEFGYNVNILLIKQLIKLHYPKNKILIITDNSPNEDIVSRRMFIFKEDDSIKTYNKKVLEIATPVFIGKKEILENFIKLFNILKILKVVTNGSCSIHINIGFSDKEETQKINLGKLYLYVNERKYLKLFKRCSNRYCKPSISSNKIKNILQYSDKQIIKQIEKYLLFLEKNHHKAIAFDKCKNNELSIIEFRFIGGDYINDFNKVYLTLVHIINAMNFSINNLKKVNTKQIITEFKKSYNV